MSSTEQDRRIPSHSRVLIVSLLVGLATWGSMLLTQKSGLPIAVIWLPNAFLLAVLLQTPRRQWPAYLIGGYLANLLAHLLTNGSLLSAPGFALCDSVEVSAAAFALRRFCGEKLDLVKTGVLLRFLVISVVGAPLTFAVLATGWLFFLDRTTSLEELKMRYTGHALGMAMIVFTAWAMQPGRFRPLFAGRRAYRSCAMFGILAGITLLNFTRHSYPFPFVIFTLLLVVAFQLGLAGAMVGSFLVCAIAIGTTITGHGPFMLLVNTDLMHRIQLLQTYVTAIMFGTLLLALQLEERQRTEEELRRANQRLELAQRAAGCGVWDRELESGHTEWSEELFALFGLDPAKDRPGLETWHSVIHPQDLRLISARLEEAEKKGTIFDVEYRVVRPGGQVRWMNALGRTTFDRSGRPVRINGICIDITEKKLAEERLHHFSRQLLSVREEEKRRLSSVLHHDVGSIAVSITARLSAAEEDLQGGNSAEALASLQECNRLFADSVGRLKTLAVELRPPDLDLLGLSAALRQHAQRVALDTGLKIELTDKTNGCPISTEAQTVLFRIAQECLNNVVKHAQASEVRVRLAVLCGQLRLAVVDNGIGFDRDSLVNETGTHLGVRAMQEMAGALGGTLVIAAKPRHGTKVSVMIPWNEKDVNILRA